MLEAVLGTTLEATLSMMLDKEATAKRKEPAQPSLRSWWQPTSLEAGFNEKLMEEMRPCQTLERTKARSTNLKSLDARPKHCVRSKDDTT